MTHLEKTKAQLKSLGDPIIGMQLQDGSKLFGRVTKFTPTKIYFKDRHGDELDVPRSIIVRAMLLLKGDKENGGPAAIRKAYQSEGGRSA